MNDAIRKEPDPAIKGLPPVNGVLDLCRINDIGLRIILTGKYELAAAAYAAGMSSLDGATYEAVTATADMMRILTTKKAVMENHSDMFEYTAAMDPFLKYAQDVHLTSANKHPRLG